MKGIEFIVQNEKEEEICMVLPEELLNEAGIGASKEIEVFTIGFDICKIAGPDKVRGFLIKNLL